ncbi:MAG: hypothetical protein QOF44_1089, partial [Streptomyces sp.]|nr:hypothetical protein [Streptomyces sp.]
EVHRREIRLTHHELPEVELPEEPCAAEVGFSVGVCSVEDELELLELLLELLELLELVPPLPLEPLADTASSGITPINANVPHSAASATPAVTIPVRAEPLRTVSAAPPDPHDMAAAPFPAHISFYEQPSGSRLKNL